MQKIEKIKYSNFEIKFHYQQLKYQKPKHSIEACIIKSKSYCINLYLPISIKYKKEKKITFE